MRGFMEAEEAVMILFEETHCLSGDSAGKPFLTLLSQIIFTA
jgi:hypothetical protein